MKSASSATITQRSLQRRIRCRGTRGTKARGKWAIEVGSGKKIPQAYKSNASIHYFRVKINTVWCRARRMGAPEGLRCCLTPQAIQQLAASGPRVREACVS